MHRTYAVRRRSGLLWCLAAAALSSLGRRVGASRVECSVRPRLSASSLAWCASRASALRVLASSPCRVPACELSRNFAHIRRILALHCTTKEGSAAGPSGRAWRTQEGSPAAMAPLWTAAACASTRTRWQAARTRGTAGPASFATSVRAPLRTLAALPALRDYDTGRHMRAHGAQSLQRSQRVCVPGLGGARAPRCSISRASYVCAGRTASHRTVSRAEDSATTCSWAANHT